MKLLTPRKSLSDACTKRNAFEFWNWGSDSINIPPQSPSAPIFPQSNMRHAGDLLILLTMWKLKKFLAFRKKKEKKKLLSLSCQFCAFWRVAHSVLSPWTGYHAWGLTGQALNLPQQHKHQLDKNSHAVCSATFSTGTETCTEECLWVGFGAWHFFLYSYLG